ncbi:MAG: hypothetical protein AB4372_01550 [Xenococcus sp. (in: cyanobacteria)]
MDIFYDPKREIPPRKGKREIYGVTIQLGENRGISDRLKDHKLYNLLVSQGAIRELEESEETEDTETLITSPGKRRRSKKQQETNNGSVLK